MDVTFERYGFYPAGGGRWTATIYPRPHSNASSCSTAGRFARDPPPHWSRRFPLPLPYESSTRFRPPSAGTARGVART